jgi:hypothetical protein
MLERSCAFSHRTVLCSAQALAGTSTRDDDRPTSGLPLHQGSRLRPNLPLREGAVARIHA